MIKKFQNLSMQKKMVLIFAVPIITVYVLLNTICYHFILERYEEQLRHSTQQTSKQAEAFLESYIQNMEHLLSIIENNGTIQEVLQSEEYENPKDMAEEYREFFKMNSNFIQFSLMDTNYDLEMYVDDERFYSVNHQYFFEESLLQQREDYEAIETGLNSNGIYLTVTDERGWESVTLLKQIYTTGITAEPRNICGVSVRKEVFEQVLKNANITSSGIVCLTDQDNQIICTSNEEMSKKVESDGTFALTGETEEWKAVQIMGERYFMTRVNIAETGWQMVSLIPMQEYEAQYGFIKNFQYLMIIVLIFLVFGTSMILSRNYVGRLRKLGEKMHVLPQENLNVQLPVALNEKSDELSEIYKHFNYMVTELQTLMQEHYKLGKEVRMTELKALQAQINPHFLYNTLDLINWMAMDYGAADIEGLVWRLSRFYRLSLNKGKNILTIQEELEHVQVYLDIENVHFSEAIEYEVDVPENIMDKACLNIILQPLVENAIVHGIAEIPEIEHMRISIYGEVEAGDVIFHIKDNGPGMSQEQIKHLESEYMNVSGKGYGVRNINFRIKLCFGEKYGITYDSELGKGTVAHVRIPIVDYKEAEKIVG